MRSASRIGLRRLGGPDGGWGPPSCRLTLRRCLEPRRARRRRRQHDEAEVARRQLPRQLVEPRPPAAVSLAPARQLLARHGRDDAAEGGTVARPRPLPLRLDAVLHPDDGPPPMLRILPIVGPPAERAVMRDQLAALDALR